MRTSPKWRLWVIIVQVWLWLMTTILQRKHPPGLKPAFCFPLSRPSPRIPLPCLLPQPSRSSQQRRQKRTTARSTASGHASVPPSPRRARWGWASSWTGAIAAKPVPDKSARCAMRPIRAITTRDCTATTARTCLGTKKECVHVSVTHWNRCGILHPPPTAHTECLLPYCWYRRHRGPRDQNIRSYMVI